jgi:hypothetical protein
MNLINNLLNFLISKKNNKNLLNLIITIVVVIIILSRDLMKDTKVLMKNFKV